MNYEDKNIYLPTLGDRIKYVREQILRLTQSDLAHKLGFKSKVTISNWEKNNGEPEVHILLTLVKLADVSLYWLLANEGAIDLGKNVTEPKTSYGITKDDIELLLSLWDVPEARDKLLELFHHRIDSKLLISEIDKQRIINKQEELK